MRITQLNASNATRYRKLMLQAYELASDAFTSTAAERVTEPESFWVKRIADPSGLSAVFGACDGEKLVGTVAVEFSAKPKTKHKASLIAMYVSPQVRGKGVGRALLEAAIEYARARAGMLQFRLTVTEDNAQAIALYSAAGFQSFGIEPMAIWTPTGYKGKVHMWLSLNDCESLA